MLAKKTARDLDAAFRAASTSPSSTLPVAASGSPSGTEPRPEPGCSASEPSLDQEAAATPPSLEMWEVEWRGLAAEAAKLDLECRDGSLGRWRLDLSFSPMRRQHALCGVRAELDESNRALDRWEDELWFVVGHARRKVAQFAKAQQEHSLMPEKLHSLADSIQHELITIRQTRLSEFDASFSDDTELINMLETIEEHYDEVLAAPSAAWPEPELGAEPGLGDTRSSLGRGAAAETSWSGEVPSNTLPQGLGEESEDGRWQEIREALSSVEAELKSLSQAVQRCTAMERKVILRTFRLFKMQLTPAFFDRLQECLPDIPPVELAARARLLAEQEGLLAKKRVLLVRWKNLKQDWQESRERERHSRHRMSFSQSSVSDQALCAERRQKATAWRQQAREETERKSQKASSQVQRQERLKEQQRLRRQAALQEGVRNFKAMKEGRRREAEVQKAAERQPVPPETVKRVQGRSVEQLRRRLEACRKVAEREAGAKSPSRSARAKLNRSAELINPFPHAESRLHHNTVCSARKIRPRVLYREEDEEGEVQEADLEEEEEEDRAAEAEPLEAAQAKTAPVLPAGAAAAQQVQLDEEAAATLDATLPMHESPLPPHTAEATTPVGGRRSPSSAQDLAEQTILFHQRISQLSKSQTLAKTP